MGRYVLAAAVVAADTALLAAGHWNALPRWGIPAYALAVALAVTLRYWSPVAAFAAALLLASLTGGGYVVTLWAAYQAGHEITSRAGAAKVAGVAAGGLTVQLAVRTAAPQGIARAVSAYAVFVLLPLLAGRYLAQHKRLVTVLEQRNRQLLRERELLAEGERLRERLRIARDMHDSLGYRLSLASVQAAALEVAALPPQHGQAVHALAGSVRSAVTELHELVGALRRDEETCGRSPGMEAIGAVVEDFRAAGLPVTLRRRGKPRPLSVTAGEAAFRLVEEGLTNAAKHAPGQPVTVSVEWEADALLLTLANPLPGRPAAASGTAAGHGLRGLDERVRSAGGFLDHERHAGGFRLVALLPVTAETAGAGLTAVGKVRTLALGLASAAVMFVALPASMLAGIR